MEQVNNNQGDTNVKKSYTDPVTGKFVKGNPGGGRPNGALDFKTKFEIFLSKIAKESNLTPQDVDEQLFAVAFKKAKEGDYQFYKDIHDRIYGKPIQPTDITSKGEQINPIPIYGGASVQGHDSDKEDISTEE